MQTGPATRRADLRIEVPRLVCGILDIPRERYRDLFARRGSIHVLSS